VKCGTGFQPVIRHGQDAHATVRARFLATLGMTRRSRFRSKGEDRMLLIIAVLVAVGMLVYVAVPLLSAESAGDVLPTDVTVVSDLKRRRLVVYDNIKDLEFEYQSGKIAKGDYEALRANYFGEATALMVATREAEQLKENEALIEREIAVRRARRKVEPKPAYTCNACGYENPVPVKFCGECGAAMAQPKAKARITGSGPKRSERSSSGKRR